jgi:hypothetical protein
LCGYNLNLVISNDSDKIFNQVDSFVALGRGNDTIRRVTLLYDVDSGNYELWDKVEPKALGGNLSIFMRSIFISATAKSEQIGRCGSYFARIYKKQDRFRIWRGREGNRRDVSFCGNDSRESCYAVLTLQHVFLLAITTIFSP